MPPKVSPADSPLLRPIDTRAARDSHAKTPPTGRAPFAWSSPGYWGALIAIVAVAYAPILRSVLTLGVVNHDVAWLVFAAGRVLDGARLYRDIIEVNPPLILALNFPAVVVGRLLHVSPILCFYTMTAGLAVLSLFLCDRVLRSVPGASERRERRWLIVPCAMVLLLLPGYDFGQREHLMLILVLPFVFAVAARGAGASLRLRLAVTTGVLAGVGFGLKPHFLLVWIALELLLWRRNAAGWRVWLRPESVAIASVLFVYAASVVLLTPDYFAVARFAAHAYGAFYPASWRRLLARPQTVITLLAVALTLRVRHNDPSKSLRQTWIVGTVALLLAAVIQRKGFSYHFYPAYACGILLLSFVLLESVHVQRRIPVRRLVASTVVIGTLLLALGDRVNAVRRGEYSPLAQLPALEQLTLRYAHPGAVQVLALSHWGAFPLINYTGARWPSRYNTLWPLPSFYADAPDAADSSVKLHPIADMSADERRVFSSVVDDILADPPDLLIVDGRIDRTFGSRRFDYLRYYAEDARFARLLTEYRELPDEVPPYTVWRHVKTGSTATTPAIDKAARAIHHHGHADANRTAAGDVGEARSMGKPHAI